ncbi:TetR/AcrR family transcriptional regulator [Streptomyces sp. NPDC051018]|uniref:TetR/AcrR family transcriptional regulator n=1 Tax=Streptomyces sp. NPDC051018 TaxID=3365639 RepID=UPI00378F202C
MLTPDPRAKPRKPAPKADELLGRIIEIVRRTGLAGFSLDSLAPELGTSSRMLVYYFGSKDELLGRIVYALRDDIVTALESRPTGTIIEAIDLWWNHYRANLTDMQFFFHLTSRSFEEPDKFQEFSSTAVDLWAAYFYRSLQNEAASDEEARAVSRLVLATLRGLMVDLLITADEQHVEKSLAEFKSLLRQRLG